MVLNSYSVFECIFSYFSGRSRGGSGGSLELPSGTKLFQFDGVIYEKSGKMLKTNPRLMDLKPPPHPKILDPPLYLANRIAPDGAQLSVASHLGLNCLPMSLKRMTGL